MKQILEEKQNSIFDILILRYLLDIRFEMLTKPLNMSLDFGREVWTRDNNLRC